MTVLEQAWGDVFDFDRIRDTLKQVRPKVLSIVQAETSTGRLAAARRARQAVP